MTRLVQRHITSRRALPGKVNQLLQHAKRAWERVSDDAADPTNNATERVLGLRLKIRVKIMRGSKSMQKILAHPYLAAFLRGDLAGRCNLRNVI